MEKQLVSSNTDHKWQALAVLTLTSSLNCQSGAVSVSSKSISSMHMKRRSSFNNQLGDIEIVSIDRKPAVEWIQTEDKQPKQRRQQRRYHNRLTDK